MKRITRRFINPTVLVVLTLSFLASLPGAGAQAIFFPVVLGEKGFCPQVVCNGDFEKGADGSWLTTSTHSLSVMVNLVDFGIVNHSGNFAAWLGGDPGEVTTIAQQITIPGNAAELSFWFWIDSNDIPGHSKATVFLDTAPLKTYDLSQAAATGAWRNDRLTIPVAFRDKVSFLIFKAEIAPDPAGVLISSFFVDDVAFPGTLAAATLENPGQTPVDRGPFPSGLRKKPLPF